MIKRKNIIHIIFIPLLVMFAIFYSIVIYQVFQNGGYRQSFVGKYTITDGNRTIVFQTMKHIGLKSFYHSVGNEMTAYRKQNYKIFAESMGYIKNPLNDKDPMYQKEKEAFIKESLVYKSKTQEIENAYLKGVKYTFQNLVIDNYMEYDDIQIDIDATTKKEDISNLINNSEKDISDKKVESLSSDDYSYDSFLSNLILRPKTTIFVENVHSSSAFIGFSKYIDRIKMVFDLKEKYRQEIVMDKRNQILADAILLHKGNIYIEYGSAHFKPVFNLLNEKTNNSFKIIDVEYKPVL